MLKLKLKMKQKFKKQFPVSSLMLMLVLVLSSFTSISLQAQDRVTGTVTGEDGIPLPGVNVLQKGTSKGAVTDFDGKFTLLLASGNKTLVFSYIGFKTKEVALGEENNVTVVLEEDVESLEEVVVIGYAAVEREKILGVPSYDDAGRAITTGSIYHVIYYGRNTMGSYANQLNENERWQVVAYVEKLKADLEK